MTKRFDRSYDFLLVFRSNHGTHLVSFPRYSQIFVECREFFYTPQAPLQSGEGIFLRDGDSFCWFVRPSVCSSVANAYLSGIGLTGPAAPSDYWFLALYKYFLCVYVCRLIVLVVVSDRSAAGQSGSCPTYWWRRALIALFIGAALVELRTLLCLAPLFCCLSFSVLLW